jgi:uncharacterized protein YbcI
MWPAARRGCDGAGPARYGVATERARLRASTSIARAPMNHDPSHHHPSSQAAAERLVEAAGPVPDDAGGAVRAALANAMVAMKKQYYGRGPTAAKAWILDDYVFVAMEGGLTRNEETLIADGKEDLVRRYRLSFQETMREATTTAVTEITGREVLTYHSQIVFHPTRAFEIFLLEPEAGAS